MKTYSALEAPFSRHGLAEGYCRLPASLFPSLRPQIAHLAQQTAGGRIRFATDARKASVRLTLRDTALKTHMTPWNMAGAELYAGQRRLACLRPLAVGTVPFEKRDGYALQKEMTYTCALLGEMRTYTLYLPAFCGVEEVLVTLPDDAAVAPAAPYTIAKPVVFYGSSITQGACAGRPSLSYPARVCAALDADFINLGMSGNALGERELAEYIAGLSMSAFVLDYDHNAPDAEHLRKTYGAFFETIRRAQPTLPILLLSRPSPLNEADMQVRFQVIEETYRAAVARGDRHVYLLDGRTFFDGADADQCLMDFVHPNDHGFACMAAHVLPALRAALA